MQHAPHKDRSHLPIISLLLGVVGVVIGPAGVLFQIGAIVIGRMAVANQESSRSATVGILLGIIGLLISVTVFVMLLIFNDNLRNNLDI